MKKKKIAKLYNFKIDGRSGVHNTSKKKRSDRLEKEIEKSMFALITTTPQHRSDIKKQMIELGTRATEHQINKLLLKWVENEDIKELPTLSDGRRVLYYIEEDV